MRLTSAHRELLFHVRIFLGVSGRSDLRPEVLSPRLRHALGRETLRARSTYTGVRPSCPARFCRAEQLRIGVAGHCMIAHANISVTQHWLKQRMDENEKARNFIAHNRMLLPSEFQRLYMYIVDWNRAVGL